MTEEARYKEKRNGPLPLVNPVIRCLCRICDMISMIILRRLVRKTSGPTWRVACNSRLEIRFCPPSSLPAPHRISRLSVTTTFTRPGWALHDAVSIGAHR